jgi:hypothetical protein
MESLGSHICFGSIALGPLFSRLPFGTLERLVLSSGYEIAITGKCCYLLRRTQEGALSSETRLWGHSGYHIQANNLKGEPGADLHMIQASYQCASF